MMMNVSDIAVGQRLMWYLRRKLGEGDAGEVYLVESTLEGKQAILKRPRQEAYSSDILRQAAQIRSEGAILQALGGLAASSTEVPIKTPAWLDQSKPEDGSGERFFIVIERASGFDLKTLRQVAHSGAVDETTHSLGAEMRYFLETIARQGVVPELVVVRALLGTLHLLEAVHKTGVWDERGAGSGVLWNDVKPEHLFWDPSQVRLTAIDWGNSLYLEADRATKDRRYTINDDYRQFLEALGAFLADSNPSLYKRLHWPLPVDSINLQAEVIAPFEERLREVHAQLTSELDKMREKEARLVDSSRVKPDQVQRLEELHRRIVTFGELPDFPGAANLHTRLLLHLASQGDLISFRQICEKTATLPGSDAEKWNLLGELARLTLEESPSEGDPKRAAFIHALSAGVADDWPACLWELAEMNASRALPSWWEGISQSARRVHLKLDSLALPPSVEMQRIYYTLQQTVRQMGDQNLRPVASSGGASPEKIQAYENLLKIFHAEVIKKWKESDPAPPNAGIAYDEFNGFLQDMNALEAGTEALLEKSLAQPKAQVRIVLDAWERKEFELARRGLRMLLLWDPERRRLLSADQALTAAPAWLSRLKAGAGSDEPFYDFITAIELDGRRLRNRLGPATWLDTLLDALKRLRKGSKYADLIIEHPEVLNEIPWLNEYRSREVLSLPRTHPLRLEREAAPPPPSGLISGVTEGKLGRNKDLHLVGALDAWTPEARGSSARVFAGSLRDRTGVPHEYAIKVMRPDRVEYSLPLFREEAQVLTLLRDVPGITPLVECGFIRLDNPQDFPGEDGQGALGAINGEAVRFGVEETQNYLASMDRYLAQDWIPYLALQRRDQEQNLMKYCDAGYTHGWFLPLQEGLLLAIQICDILQSAHDRNIVYRDHKILHYYWDPQSQGVVMIDWNIAKRQPQGLTDAERQFDLAQFGARALHHILTGRPAAGALPMGPNRPEEIEQSALRYPVNWTFDDERLPNRVKEIIAQVLNQGYTNLRELRGELAEVYTQISGAPAATNAAATG